MEPIGVASKKFSDIAARWDPFKKEAYAVYYGVHHFAYYLRGKAILLAKLHYMAKTYIGTEKHSSRLVE